ncbi:hypothetical protein BAE44_0021830 [Dichanthelium oligosanthes]|uniref:Uncharacterized protein n=1 Tax=Dichanthelium oligosanthes TaxID=888268 RepID=A0A1E5UW97_9POAL|nr:hypothetical protein BAE44_0021830 [Dichanthelium oligosanthes]
MAANGTVPAGDRQQTHAVCVPFRAQGHVTPMVKLAKVLYCRGFHVTFVNTEYNHRRLIRTRGPVTVAGLPGFRFACPSPTPTPRRTRPRSATPP